MIGSCCLYAVRWVWYHVCPVLALTPWLVAKGRSFLALDTFKPYTNTSFIHNARRLFNIYVLKKVIPYILHAYCENWADWLRFSWAMPETISRREKLDALTLVSTGHTRDSAAHLMHISKSTIQRAKRKQKLFGDIEGGKKKRGRRAKFTPEIINVCSRLQRM